MGNIKLNIIDACDEYQILDLRLTENGIVEPSNINDLILPDNIDTRKGVIIYGKAPVWLYSYLIHECHSFSWVATFDPRIGGIVVQSHNNQRKIAEIIPSENILFHIKREKEIKNKKEKEIEAKVIAFIGSPHSGKSVLLYQIQSEIIQKIGVESFNQDCFIIRGCPDGEGNWFSEISEVQGKIIRYKNTFDDEFPEQIANHIKETTKSKKLVFVDCGGIIDKKNQIILNECTHGIIVSSSPNLVDEWIGAAKSSEIEILAIIDSVLDEVSEVSNLNPLRIKYGKLERQTKPTNQLPDQLINRIVNYV